MQGTTHHLPQVPRSSFILPERATKHSAILSSLIWPSKTPPSVKYENGKIGRRLRHGRRRGCLFRTRYAGWSQQDLTMVTCAEIPSRYSSRCMHRPPQSICTKLTLGLHLESTYRSINTHSDMLSVLAHHHPPMSRPAIAGLTDLHPPLPQITATSRVAQAPAGK
ncbi:hypothetical protein LZ31DRAFT_157652 [Colletotrichum somersetense]|nr:hypothetical protein LZ31DRAFT_157652 [Colletotrichum somersetense]